ncbi:hypothetical protein J4204_01535 [Candidatus Woesearchaeota archaeon]|nr:hypothetical protein [Candidatus Woesearchaeota archaeon]
MRKVGYFILLMGFLVILAGCKQTPTLPYIEPSSPVENIIKAEQEFNLEFFVYNPTVNTFVGTLEYEFDNKCLDIMQGNSNEVEVAPNNKKGIVKDFAYGEREYMSPNNYRVSMVIEKCFQTSLPISVSLYDKSKLIRDKKTFFLTITE